MFLLSGFHSGLFTAQRCSSVLPRASDGHDNDLGGSQRKNWWFILFIPPWFQWPLLLTSPRNFKGTSLLPQPVDAVEHRGFRASYWRWSDQKGGWFLGLRHLQLSKNITCIQCSSCCRCLFCFSFSYLNFKKTGQHCWFLALKDNRPFLKPCYFPSNPNRSRTFNILEDRSRCVWMCCLVLRHPDVPLLQCRRRGRPSPDK